MPRGPRRFGEPGTIFSPLGRVILDRVDRGVVVIDATGRILDANALAWDAMRACDGFDLTSGRFGFADSRLERGMHGALAEYRSGVTHPRAVLAARVRCRRGGPFSVVVLPVPPEITRSGAAFFAVIYEPNGQHRISGDVLREMYGLTQAQAEVARQLVAGRTVEKAARALGLSLNTVRSHLKQIFTKCEVASQAELLHLLALGPNRF